MLPPLPRPSSSSRAQPQARIKCTTSHGLCISDADVLALANDDVHFWAALVGSPQAALRLGVAPVHEQLRVRPPLPPPPRRPCPPERALKRPRPTEPGTSPVLVRGIFAAATNTPTGDAGAPHAPRLRTVPLPLLELEEQPDALEGGFRLDEDGDAVAVAVAGRGDFEPESESPSTETWREGAHSRRGFSRTPALSRGSSSPSTTSSSCDDDDDDDGSGGEQLHRLLGAPAASATRTAARKPLPLPLPIPIPPARGASRPSSLPVEWLPPVVGGKPHPRPAAVAVADYDPHEDEDEDELARIEYRWAVQRWVADQAGRGVRARVQ